MFWFWANLLGLFIHPLGTAVIFKESSGTWKNPLEWPELHRLNHNLTCHKMATRLWRFYVWRRNFPLGGWRTNQVTITNKPLTIVSDAGALIVITVSGISIHPSIIHPSNILLRRSSATSNSALTFPNNIYRNGCQLCGNVKQFEWRKQCSVKRSAPSFSDSIVVIYQLCPDCFVFSNNPKWRASAWLHRAVRLPRRCLWQNQTHS